MSLDADADSNVLWQRRLSDLRAWKQKHSNCTVPKAEGKLGRWVVRQRELHKKGKLEKDRRLQLDALGFVWNTNEAAWSHRFTLLLRYATTNGHCCVPISDPVLGMWVAKMRANHRRGKLPSHRVRKLEQIGFVWNTAEADWMDKFDKLLAFRRREGHACVPFNEGELGWWVNTQRQSKRKGKLSADRERLLNQAAFVWNPQEFLAARRRHIAATIAAASNAESISAPTSDGMSSGKTTPSPTARKRRLEACDEDHASKKYKLAPLLGTESFGTTTTRWSKLTDVDDARSSDPATRPHTSLAQEESTRRIDLTSVASMLSPLPASPSLSVGTVLPPPSKVGMTTLDEPAMTKLPSFFGGRTRLSAFQNRHVAQRDFFLPPISALKAVSEAPKV